MYNVYEMLIINCKLWNVPIFLRFLFVNWLARKFDNPIILFTVTFLTTLLNLMWLIDHEPLNLRTYECGDFVLSLFVGKMAW
jgi:hypothetical protein